MAEKRNRKSRIIRKRLMAVAVMLMVVVIVIGLLWNRYLNKNSLLEKYEAFENQEVYLLGTFHENHFNQWFNYSMEDLLSVVENVQPDTVFIEAREEIFKNYGVMDGPVDMAVVYSYCQEHKIPVEMIDWWEVENDYQSNTTDKKRDDRIYTNIIGKLKEKGEGTRVLVICGAGHFYEQTERFANNGFQKQKIIYKAAFFENADRAFEYPESVVKVWEQRAYFYAYTYPEVIGRDETLDEAIKTEFTEGNHDAFYKQQLEYCALFSKNTLYK